MSASLLHVESVGGGSGPPLVLVHGFGACNHFWRHWTPVLTRDHPVHQVELTGFGSAPTPSGADLSPPAQAERLVDFLDTLEGGPPVLVGHSLGAAVVLLAALRLLDRESADSGSGPPPAEGQGPPRGSGSGTSDGPETGGGTGTLAGSENGGGTGALAGSENGAGARAAQTGDVGAGNARETSDDRPAGSPRPRALRGIVLISGAVYPQRLPPYLTLSRIPVVGELLLLLPPPHWALRMGIRGIVHDRSTVTDSQVEGYRRPLGSWKRRRAILRAARQIRPELGRKLSPRYREIEVPTLALWGSEDRVVPPEFAHRLAGELPHASEVILPRVGHLPPEEAPEESLEAIRHFLVSLPTS